MSAIHHILATFRAQNINISEFLICLLSSAHFSEDPLVHNLQTNAATITRSLLKLNDPALMDTHTFHEITRTVYQREIKKLVQKENGWQFNATHASVDQLNQFRIEYY
jgi:hypothetical protein